MIRWVFVSSAVVCLAVSGLALLVWLLSLHPITCSGESTYTSVSVVPKTSNWLVMIGSALLGVAFLLAGLRIRPRKTIKPGRPQ